MKIHHYISAAWATLVLLAAALTACDEYSPSAVHVIRFSYDTNMKFADAFQGEVPSVSLYVFDKNGRLVTTVSQDVDKTGESTIKLNSLPKGHYDLLAWCGVKDNEHFVLNHNGVKPLAFDNLTCLINSDANGHIRNDIGNLYYGRLDNVDMNADDGLYEHVIHLTKNTNTVHITLQHLSGAPVGKGNFEFAITDANALYGPDNTLLPYQTLTYHPWEIKTETGQTATFTVGRLMADHGEDAMLTVRNNLNGKQIISIPLIKFLLVVKDHYHNADGTSHMSDQEYLDRKDEYAMTLFLDEDDNWIKTIMYIDQWRVVLNE